MSIRCFIPLLALAMAAPATAADEPVAAAGVTCADGTLAASADRCNAAQAPSLAGRVLTIVTSLAGDDGAPTSMLAEAAAWSLSGSVTGAGPASILAGFIDITVSTASAPEVFVTNTGKESIDSCFFCPKED